MMVWECRRRNGHGPNGSCGRHRVVRHLVHVTARPSSLLV